MTSIQLKGLTVGRQIYCKRHPGRPITYWLITHIFPDCVWVEADIQHYTGKSYRAKRVVYLRRLERDWEVWT